MKDVRPIEATGKNKIRRMRFVCLTTKATNTHSEYVIRLALLADIMKSGNTAL